MLPSSSQGAGADGWADGLIYPLHGQSQLSCLNVTTPLFEEDGRQGSPQSHELTPLWIVLTFESYMGMVLACLGTLPRGLHDVVLVKRLLLLSHHGSITGQLRNGLDFPPAQHTHAYTHAHTHTPCLVLCSENAWCHSTSWKRSLERRSFLTLLKYLQKGHKTTLCIFF